MGDRKKQRDDFAKNDQVRHALGDLKAAVGDVERLRPWGVMALMSPDNHHALMNHLTGGHEDRAVSALAALAAQHLSGIDFDEVSSSRIDTVASRLLEPMPERMACEQTFVLRLEVLRAAYKTSRGAGAVPAASAFLGSLESFDVLHEEAVAAAKGKVSPRTAWRRIEGLGSDATRWAAIVQLGTLWLASTAAKAELAMAAAEAMRRSGHAERLVISVLGCQVVSHPEAADALLAALDCDQEHMLAHCLHELCVRRPEVSGCDVVRDATSDLAWQRLVKRLGSGQFAENPMAAVWWLRLHHLLGRDVSPALDGLLGLHPTNRGVRSPSLKDEEVAEEIEAFSKLIGKDIVPTRLGWAS